MVMKFKCDSENTRNGHRYDQLGKNRERMLVRQRSKVKRSKETSVKLWALKFSTTNFARAKNEVVSGFIGLVNVLLGLVRLCSM